MDLSYASEVDNSVKLCILASDVTDATDTN